MGDPENQPTGPAADAVSSNRQFLTSPSAFLLQVRAQLGLDIVNVSDDNLALAVFNYQTDAGLDAPDGKLRPDTVQRLHDVEQLGSSDWGNALDQRDESEIQDAITSAAGPRGSGAGEDDLRHAIIGAAMTQVGKINSLNRGDGKKYGYKRLVHFFGACDGPAQPESVLSPANAGPPREWCGIFAVWAVNAVTGNGSWGADSPVGFTKVWRADDQGLDRIKQGDILAIAALSHHFLFDRRDGDTLYTVDGNGMFQGIATTTHPAADIVAYYTTVGG